jgi:TrmH family RNA methyltransferase
VSGARGAGRSRRARPFIRENGITVRQDLVSSAANPVVKRIRLLAERKHRRREGVFVVEGGQPVWRAVEAGWQIEALVIAPELLAGHPALRMAQEQERAGVRVVRLTRDLFERIADRDGPMGVMALVHTRLRSLAELRVGQDTVFAAMDRISNPGNLGTIIRTVDAVGGAGVVLVGDSTDPFAPAAVKASMGSLFAVDIAHAPDIGAFYSWARGNGVRVLATSGGASTTHWQADYSAPAAILLGNEGEGLPADAIAQADQQVRIPMVGTVESLNIAVAAAAVLYEARRAALHGE